jgi:hypothetical protein
MRMGLTALVLVALSGCGSLGGVFDAGLSRAESVSGEMTARSLDWICHRISLRQWRETFGQSQHGVMGWTALCAPVTSVPVGPGELRRLPSERPS